ncbi:MAG TPA: GspE/PulE family protein [Gemmataceae bacterium]|nr:GspE/PulE family protein [Gemmataceae bacterium]
MSAAVDAFRIEVDGFSPEAAVRRLLEHAARLQASDLFLLAGANEMTISVRHLGVMRIIATVSSDFGKHCKAHIQAMADMNLADHRKPHDGRWLFESNGQHIDLRISSLPTLHGEDLALRLLVRESVLLDLDNLGLRRKEYNQLIELLACPSGLILVTGPTGAGKTTTLYACLHHLNNGVRKINTIEDPIEYTLDGIRQTRVDARLDLQFPELLRAVLRQAPDVIMIGEIRDPMTAETAVRAANSGHLVLATLHAPIGVGAVQSMLALGVLPHFLASSLRGVIAQRLVRTLCVHCRGSIELGEVAPHTFDEVKDLLGSGEGQCLYVARGCVRCQATGYVARTGVFEVLPISPAMRRLIMERQPTPVLRTQALEEGAVDIRQAAMLRVARGETTTEEVLRVIPPEYLGLDDGQ